MCARRSSLRLRSDTLRARRQGAPHDARGHTGRACAAPIPPRPSRFLDRRERSFTQKAIKNPIRVGTTSVDRDVCITCASPMPDQCRMARSWRSVVMLTGAHFYTEADTTEAESSHAIERLTLHTDTEARHGPLLVRQSYRAPRRVTKSPVQVDNADVILWVTVGSRRQS
jgi:hypothetical protein